MTGKRPPERFTISLPDEQLTKDELRELADAEGYTSVSKYIRELILRTAEEADE